MSVFDDVHHKIDRKSFEQVIKGIISSENQKSSSASKIPPSKIQIRISGRYLKNRASAISFPEGTGSQHSLSKSPT